MIDFTGLKCKCGADATAEWTFNLGEAIDYVCEDCLFELLLDTEGAQEGPDDT